MRSPFFAIAVVATACHGSPRRSSTDVDAKGSAMRASRSDAAIEAPSRTRVVYQLVSDFDRIAERMCACEDAQCWQETDREVDARLHRAEVDLGPLDKLEPEATDAVIRCLRCSPSRWMFHMLGFHDEMCACQDRACVDKVNEEIDAWAKRYPRTQAPSGLPFPDDNRSAELRRGTVVGLAMARCLCRALGPDCRR
jgi:hypothetical protein